MVSLCSCHVMKKTNHTNKTNVEVVTKTKSSDVDVKKNDSTGTNTTRTTGEATSQSGYTKTTTTVREYFSDEFGEPDTQATKKDTGRIHFYYAAGPNFRVDTILRANNEPKLKLRETITTFETGFKNDSNSFAGLTETAGKISASDSINKSSEATNETKTTQASEDNSKFSLSFLPWWLWLIVGLMVLGYFFIRFKT